MDLIKEKAMKTLLITGVVLVMFISPIIAGGSVIAAPVAIVSDFFNAIGDFTFGMNSEADDLVVLIQESINSQEAKREIYDTYSAHLTKNGVVVPVHYLVVVQMISGIEFENMNETLINEMVDLLVMETKAEGGDENDARTYELVDLNIYATKIKQVEPFKNRIEHISSSSLAELIQRVGGIDRETSLSPELIAKYEGRLMYPFKKYYDVGSSIGYYSPNGKREVHNGLDLKAPCGVATYAMEGGVVTAVGTNDYWRGNYVFWYNEELDMEMRYLHFRDPLSFNVYDTIEKGQFMGYVGNTGYSFGCHLHLETRVGGIVEDPLLFFDAYNPILD